MQTNRDSSAAKTSAALSVAPQDAFDRLKADWLNARGRFNSAVWSLCDDIWSLTMLSDCTEFRSQARHNRAILMDALLGSTAVFERALDRAGGRSSAVARATIYLEQERLMTSFSSGVLLSVFDNFPALSLRRALTACQAVLGKIRRLTLLTDQI